VSAVRDFLHRAGQTAPGHVEHGARHLPHTEVEVLDQRFEVAGGKFPEFDPVRASVSTQFDRVWATSPDGRGFPDWRWWGGPLTLRFALYV